MKNRIWLFAFIANLSLAMAPAKRHKPVLNHALALLELEAYVAQGHNLYAALGVPRNALAEHIHLRIQELIDRYAHDQEISVYYAKIGEILADKSLKAFYDDTLNARRNNQKQSNIFGVHIPHLNMNIVLCEYVKSAFEYEISHSSDSCMLTSYIRLCDKLIHSCKQKIKSYKKIALEQKLIAQGEFEELIKEIEVFPISQYRIRQANCINLSTLYRIYKNQIAYKDSIINNACTCALCNQTTVDKH